MKKQFLIILLLNIGAGALWGQQVNQLIFAKINGAYPMWDGTIVKTMGFTYTLNAAIDIPSPTLVFNEGDTVKLTLWNKSQGAPHTIHLHGLDVDQQNDGVPHLSFDIAHDDKGDYHFVAPHAGTYLYHCHVVSTLHVQAGMYGMLIVRPSDGSQTAWNNGPAYDTELAWLMSEVDTVWHHDTIINHPHDTTQTQHHLPERYLPQYFLVNGKAEQQLAAQGMAVTGSANEVFYLRLANIGNYGNRLILPAGLHARIIASDGRPLPHEEQADTLLIFPGERYGVLLEPTAEFTDTIKIDYLDLNTQITINTQQIPVAIAGFFGTESLNKLPLACTLFPNPTNDYLEGEITLEKEELILGKWIGINGRVLSTFEQQGFAGVNSLQLNTQNLQSGIYFLQLQTATRQTIKKITIQQ
ncbi:multicopper oxidase domain-containing protein [Aureispira anguillae]|uniref:Multicopper oxidase domain-containing protein n=1 Tax=Aureispira anguillae TaxID=2864201 RepID=A0A915VK12_9BACT|nr:multicopper oxidase domain-containing protein [Aureispira anguillae]BDS09439.1 multicopper oxidase domain-containing protein [Aureispira anguillae]